MFGYIQPLECELRVREQTLYRACYCGLCRTIGARYGLPARMVLNYDCAFLALFLSTLTGLEPCERARCFLKPFKKPQPVLAASPALEYAADVNVLLTAYQQLDEWKDEKKLSALGAGALLKGAFEKAAALRPALAGEIAEGLDKLSEIEKRCSKDADEAACAFGKILENVAAMYPALPKEGVLPVKWTFFNLGRWIYLADAWDDRAKDEKQGAYNPFLAAGAGAEDAGFQLHISLTEAEKGYDLVSFAADSGILDNIMHLGCRAVTERLLGKSKGAGA